MEQLPYYGSTDTIQILSSGFNRYSQLSIGENYRRVHFLPRGAIYWRAYIGESGCTKCLLCSDLRGEHCQIKRPFVKKYGRVLKLSNFG